MSQSHAFHEVLCTLLREMDREAGRKWGLEDYGWFARPELIKPMTEWEWIRELERDLPKRGFRVERRCRYPAPGKGKCDLVLTGAGGQRTWLEVRGAWRAYWEALENLAKFRWDLNECASDIEALSKLQGKDAGHAGVLLLGFGKADDELASDVRDWSKERFSGWALAHSTWPAANDPKKTVHVWLWTRVV